MINIKYREIAIGDVHGCLKTLKALLFDKIEVKKEDYLYFVGDYIDRGPYSKEVIDLLIELKSTGYKIRTIKGNHEEMMNYALHFKDDDYNSNFTGWLASGGKATIQSYSRDTGDFLIPKRHKDFYKSLEPYIVLEDYVICHAGMNFFISNPFDDTNYMLWDREDFVIPEKIGFRKLIVGHTPKTLNEIYSSIQSNKIYIDGGCAHYPRRPDLGYLVGFEINTLEIYSQKCLDYQ